MCTLIVAIQAWPGVPLLVAANRDENVERPAGRPRAWTDRPLPVFAPEDLQGAGSWLGINSRGLFVGITNRFGSTPPSPNRRSRGLLVLDALDENNASDAAERVAAYPPETYNRFHLVLADSNGAWLVVGDGEKLGSSVLDHGVHLITERSFGAGPAAREALIRARFESFKDRPPDNDSLIELLSIHRDDPFEGTCVHAPQWHYATRSSSIIRLGSGPERLEFLHAEGPPCRSAFSDLSNAARTALFG